uniref:Response regulator n=1 Tax=Desertifilum tharense IPPAS B-1220 TaxID=1781255 RepID=A0ACD5H2C2_9CYAN
MRQTLKRSLLPAAPTTQPMDAGLQVENTKQKRVLVVEDQPYNQALISEVLELENYTVELIGDGRSMLETIHSPLVTRRTLPSLILMDIHLPEVDGLELINQLRAHDLWQTVPIVARYGNGNARRSRSLFGGGCRCLSQQAFRLNSSSPHSRIPDWEGGGRALNYADPKTVQLRISIG